MFPRILFFLLLGLLVLSACDRRSSIYIKRIDNQTDKTLSFYFFEIYNRGTYGDTVTVLPFENKEILYFAEEGSVVYGPQGCVVVDDSIDVEIDSSRQMRLLKDLRKEEDWTFKEIGSEQVCTFEITDADIQ
jgi:hypothetical protein